MVIGGSGFRREYIDITIENNADALVSGEMRHDAIRYADKLCFIEAPAMKKLCERLPVELIYSL